MRSFLNAIIRKNDQGETMIFDLDIRSEKYENDRYWEFCVAAAMRPRRSGRITARSSNNAAGNSVSVTSAFTAFSTTT